MNDSNSAAKELHTSLIEERLGKVALSPSGSVVAGTMGQWTLTYQVGSYGIDEGGTLKISRRFASDWQRPQFDQPTQPGYTTATTDGEAKLSLHWDPKGHVRPWMKCLVIDVYDGSLAPGDTVTITMGDRSQGSPGIRAQSFQESHHEMRFLVDPTNACLVRRIPTSPVFPVVAGPPARLVVIVPSQATVEQRVEVFVRGEDQWGNPTEVPDGVSLDWSGDPVATIDAGAVSFEQPGSGQVVATWNGQIARSNPITVYDDLPRYKRYWGDLHAQTDATVGTGTEVEYFTFGRDQARLDFISHQGNDFQMTDSDWQRLNDVTREFHQDDRYVVLPGYEWSANTTAGGDRNVIYPREGMPIVRSSHWQIPEVQEDAVTPAHPADVFFEKLRENVDPNEVLVISHVGGRYADIRKYFDQQLAPLVEVTSCWGVFEWLLWDALERGYQVGVVCNSDGHKGRPGAEGPGAGEFGIAGGLTCVLAESLSRNAIFEALKQRRCYGTTGPRIDLSFTVDGHPMGAEITARQHVRVEAAARSVEPLESLQLHQGNQVIGEVRPSVFDDCGQSRRLRVSWSGARIRGRGRRAVWDGKIQLSDAKIQQVTAFAFDSPADGFQQLDERTVQFRSRTTGDTDGIDLLLDNALSGTIKFDSPFGPLEADLNHLSDRVQRQYGGLGLQATIQRYPETLSDRVLTLSCDIPIAAGEVTPLMIKAIQSDGHTGWSSPVYVESPAHD